VEEGGFGRPFVLDWDDQRKSAIALCIETEVTRRTQVRRLDSLLKLENFFLMSRLDQFEVLQLVGDKWELVAAFPQMELATEVARNRANNVRLVRATYEDGKKIAEDIILDLGATRGVA
jgi:hypothetical protein